MCIRSDDFANFWAVMKDGYGNNKFWSGAYNGRQNELRHFAKNGLFYVLLTSKEGNIAFLPHPLRAMLCPCSSYQ